MVELLVIMGVETRDALLEAIDQEFVEAVELLLEHEELIRKEGDPYVNYRKKYQVQVFWFQTFFSLRCRQSWQKVDINIAQYPPEITPLILAAHKNNYEIIKLLLDRGATLPQPHDVKCPCDDCIRKSIEDPLRHSLSRVREYRALASPSLIALSSTDPISTAFAVSKCCKLWSELQTLMDSMHLSSKLSPMIFNLHTFHFHFDFSSPGISAIWPSPSTSVRQNIWSFVSNVNNLQLIYWAKLVHPTSWPLS